MVIRLFEEDDAYQVAELSNKNSKFFKYSKVSPAFLIKFCDSLGFRMFVLEMDGKIGGFCGLHFENPAMAELGPICVDHKYRHMGLAYELVNKVTAYAQKRRIAAMMTKCKSFNMPAINLFKKLGFKEQERHSSDKGQETVVLVKVLVNNLTQN